MSRRTVRAHTGKLPQKDRGVLGEYQTSGNPPDPSQNGLERQSDGTPSTGAAIQEVLCDGCGIGFTPRRKGQKYHSGKCRTESWKKKQDEVQAGLGGDPVPVIGIQLAMQSDGRGLAACGFCRRLNSVDLKRDGRQNHRCRCGARFFSRVRKVRGRLIHEWGWKRGRHRWFYL